jgi:tetratricopeptide (TPR) repeat protein
MKPLTGWTADQVEAGVKAVIARADTPELEAAAAMHLEIGIAIAGLANRSAVGYFDQASRLMAATMPPAAIRRGLSAERLTDINEANSVVLRVAASALIAVNDLVHARPLALNARKVAPLSAAALTIAGLVEEMEASRYDPELWDAVMLRTRDSRERARLLRIAEQFYSDALEADRSYVLARIRLGRVQFLEGAVSRARASLEAGRAAARDPRHRFLAALFLGALQLQQNDLDAARRSFEEAVAIIPQSQDAISGLAYTELIAGRVNRAEEIARRYTAAATEETWWAYKNAALDFEGLKWIRERVHR